MRYSIAVCLIIAPLFAQTEPSLTLEQKEEFLKKAKVIKTKGAKKGITGTVRATLTDGKITHDASIQTIDEEKPRMETAGGIEFNFRDTYKFNLAAYKLGKLLGLGTMMPPSVERHYEGKNGAWTWWVGEMQMDETERIKKKDKGPDKDKWARQYLIMKVFDQLIYNTDRNQQNILYDKDWRLWMIDHTRAFRPKTDLQNAKALERCDRKLLGSMKALTPEQVKTELGPYLRETEIKGLLARRDKIVAYYESAGEAKLYDQLP